jgi:hypothetical protein
MLYIEQFTLLVLLYSGQQAQKRFWSLGRGLGKGGRDLGNMPFEVQLQVVREFLTWSKTTRKTNAAFTSLKGDTKDGALLSPVGGSCPLRINRTISNEICTPAGSFDFSVLFKKGWGAK